MHLSPQRGEAAHGKTGTPPPQPHIESDLRGCRFNWMIKHDHYVVSLDCLISAHSFEGSTHDSCQQLDISRQQEERGLPHDTSCLHVFHRTRCPNLLSKPGRGQEMQHTVLVERVAFDCICRAGNVHGTGGFGSVWPVSKGHTWAVGGMGTWASAFWAEPRPALPPHLQQLPRQLPPLAPPRLCLHMISHRSRPQAAA